MSSNNPQFPDLHPHLPVGTFPVINDLPVSPAAMQQRIRELEALCADVYEVAVLEGFPDALLTRLWIVAAHGNSPQGYTLETPPVAPLPDVALIHRPTAPAATLSPLPELEERKTVMVVEDDPAMLDLIIKILSSENYDLIAAESGDAALGRVLKGDDLPDLLITDLMMPGIDGRQLAGELRKRVPSLRVLYQTGFTDILFKQKQELEAGAAFLEKPFTARGLIEASRLTLFGTMNPSAAPEQPAEMPRRWGLLGRRSA